MKIGEASEVYSARTKALWDRKLDLSKRQKELQENGGDKEELDAVTLELSGVNKEYDTMHEFMEKLNMLKAGLHNVESSKQQSEAMKDAAEEELKCLEIARRIASGAKVPDKDAKKLMEYNAELYMAAVNAAMLNQHKSRKKYDSLWEDEDKQNNQQEDIDAKIDNRELTLETPEIGTSESASLEAQEGAAIA